MIRLFFLSFFLFLLPLFAKDIVDFPNWEKTPDELEKVTTQTLEKSTQALNRLAQLTPKETNFQNTLGQLDQIYFDISFLQNRINLLSSVSPSEPLRQKAQELDVLVQKWRIEANNRKDVYLVIKSYADRNQPLRGEAKRLLEHTLRDYKRMGFHLPEEVQKKIVEIQKELTSLSNTFEANINDTNKLTMNLTEEDVKGTPASALENFTRDDKGNYLLHAGVQYEIVAILENSPNEELRKKVHLFANTRTRVLNETILLQILQKKAELAQLQRYPSWADYKTEILMSKNGLTVKKFLQDLINGIDPKYKAELEILQELKRAETKDPNAILHIWDKDYYLAKYKNQHFQINVEELKNYFPLEQVQKGMFKIFEKLFALEIRPITPPYVWSPEVTAVEIRDAKTKKSLGLLYLDLFPRAEQNKYNHFALFNLRPNKEILPGVYHRPVAALICNFPKPSTSGPSLLSLYHVTTYFHEFGHALHEILSQNQFASFAGTNVATDFVEAPSQLLERWVMEKEVLNTFAADYRDSSKKIPSTILKKIKEAEKATMGLFYKRQLSFAMLDFMVHTQIPVDVSNDFPLVSYSNSILNSIFLPYPEEASFITNFGHIVGGYDSGYYGYAWADSIAADLASIFEKAPHRFLDTKTGLKLRKYIYEKGGTEDEKEMVENFLGRPMNNQAFLKKLGIER